MTLEVNRLQSSNLLRFLSRVGADPADTQEIRLKKALLVGWSLMFIPVGFLWGAIYLAYGEAFAGAIPASYSLITLLGFIYYGFSHRYRFFRTSQLILVLLLPFLLMLALGGFISSSAVVLWSITSPFGATLIAERRHARYLLVAYFCLLTLSGLLQPYLRQTNSLPEWLVTLFFVMNLGTVPALVYVLLDYFIGQKDIAYRLLGLEQEKSESLLLNILPADVATALKNDGRAPAMRYGEASILFADMAGFTPLSAALSPEATVELLNEIYTHLDRLVEKYAVEKIRTIGDNYMVASGVPRPRPDHASALARMALELNLYIQARPPIEGIELKFRIGINSGPVVAGVVGQKKFQYDVWGEAVNTASRMESQGAPGKIQVTRATYELIKDEFICEARGVVDIKGVGEMETWFLVGELPA
ncbi:MAG TPA: adenylate/guanylate cyclase domain-containing protein [Anaerolineales bacterium]|nr:adenylate/guanylate cyclase domain-containing protein [Anaerolineales bacterium]